jgi:Ran GTPase-activating protein (RanGAP) involved in mRNA processing and transport
VAKKGSRKPDNDGASQGEFSGKPKLWKGEQQPVNDDYGESEQESMMDLPLRPDFAASLRGLTTEYHTSDEEDAENSDEMEDREEDVEQSEEDGMVEIDVENDEEEDDEEEEEEEGDVSIDEDDIMSLTFED